MADFLEFDATVDDNDNNDGYNSEVEDTNISDIDEFIDDTNYDESVEPYYAFTNVNRRLEDAVQDSFNDFDFSQEADNHCSGSYDPSDDVTDEFKDSAKIVDNFKSTILILHGLENIDSFYFALLCAIRYQFKKKKDEWSIDELKNDIKNNQLYDAFFSTKDNLKFHLDNQNFGNQCFSVNGLLIKHSLFLRIYDSKDKFHYLIKQDSEKKSS